MITESSEHDRLAQIQHRIMKGYVNSHRWDDADEIPLGVDMLAYAEGDIEWLLDEVERLRTLIADQYGESETWPDFDRESQRLRHAREHRADGCSWIDCPDYGANR